MLEKDFNLRYWISRINPRALFVLGLLTMIFLWSAAPARAQIGVDLVLQQSQFEIDELAEQETASGWGVYMFVPLGSMAFAELNHEETSITFKSADDLIQGDNGLALNLMMGPSVIYLGGHQIDSTSEYLEGAKTSGAGIKIFDILSLSLGGSGYQSEYPNYPLSDATGDVGLEVKQTSPELGITLFGGYLNIDGKRDSIVLSDSLGYEKTEYVSNQVGVSLYISPLVFYYASWTGERMFQASNKALEVASLPYLYQGGNKASIRLSLGEMVSVSVGLTKYQYQETPEGDPMEMQVKSAALVFRF